MELFPRLLFVSINSFLIKNSSENVDWVLKHFRDDNFSTNNNQKYAFNNFTQSFQTWNHYET